VHARNAKCYARQGGSPRATCLGSWGGLVCFVEAVNRQLQVRAYSVCEVSLVCEKVHLVAAGAAVLEKGSH